MRAHDFIKDAGAEAASLSRRHGWFFRMPTTPRHRLPIFYEFRDQFHRVLHIRVNHDRGFPARLVQAGGEGGFFAEIAGKFEHAHAAVYELAQLCDRSVANCRRRRKIISQSYFDAVGDNTFAKDAKKIGMLSASL